VTLALFINVLIIIIIIIIIVESCPLTKLNGGLSRLHSADEDAVSWLTSYGSRQAYEKKTTEDLQGDHSPDDVKFLDNSLTVRCTPLRHSAC